MVKEMVITPRLIAGRKSPRQRLVEDRRTDSVRKRKRRMIRKALAIRRARSRGRRGRRRGGGAIGGFAVDKLGARFGSKFIPVIGWLALATEILAIGGELNRRFIGGESGGFVAATDADVMMGSKDEELQATTDARAFIESNDDLMRIIKKQGWVNDQIYSLFLQQKKRQMTIRTGEDLMSRDHRLDSPQTLVDLIVDKARKAYLKNRLDAMMAAWKEVRDKEKGA